MDDNEFSTRRPARAAGDPLDQRLDRWVSAGRQLVEGVSGARPGTRPAPRPGESRSGARPGGARAPALEGLGRWVEDRLDWLLEDGDDWREPWQEAPGPAGGWSPTRPSTARPGGGGGAGEQRPRRSLEAISRRGPVPAAADPEDWPDDASFSLPRWQRPVIRPQPVTTPRPTTPRPTTPLPEASPPEVPAPGRPLPRSSRRR